MHRWTRGFEAKEAESEIGIWACFGAGEVTGAGELVQGRWREGRADLGGPSLGKA